VKGLLLKDFQLLKNQKMFFIIIVVTAIGLSASTGDSSFVIGYMTFVGTLFTLSTISYDEFDNGSAFLFTLPITRKTYVAEKYAFGLIMGMVSWLLSVAVSIASVSIKHTMTVSDTLMTAFMLLPSLVLILAVMLPFQLKFGSEKGRIAIIGAVGLLILIGLIAVELGKLMGIDLASVLNHLPLPGIGAVTAGSLGFGIIALLISIKISIGIMNHKEF